MSKLTNIMTALRFGMVLYKLLPRLEKIGINISPYYFIQEGIEDFKPPELPGLKEDYIFDFFGQEDVRKLDTKRMEFTAFSKEKMLKRLKEGQKFFGVKFKKEIAAYMWVDFKKCSFPGYEMPLNNGEAYMYNMYTLKAFRGRNIAPNLRYFAYKKLKSIGYDKLYSYSDYFNSPSVKFKQKLHAKFLWLEVHISIFKRFKKNFIIKRYNTGHIN